MAGTTFKLVRSVGHGSFAVVYKALKTEEDDIVHKLHQNLRSNPALEYHADHDDNQPLPALDGKRYFPSLDIIASDNSIPGAFIIPLSSGIEDISVEDTFALKFSNDFVGLQKDLLVDSLLNERFKVGWDTNVGLLGFKKIGDLLSFKKLTNLNEIILSQKPFAIIGPYYPSLSKSIFQDPDNLPIPFKRAHVSILVENLLDIHENKMIHRDIRSSNLLQKGDYFIIIDHGCSCGKGSSNDYAGTEETASQMVLFRLMNNQTHFEVSPEDDFESLLKMILTILEGKTPPDQKPEQLDMSYYDDLFDYWMHDPIIRTFIKLNSLAEKVEYIRTTFAQDENKEATLKRFRLSDPKNEATALSLGLEPFNSPAPSL